MERTSSLSIALTALLLIDSSAAHARDPTCKVTQRQSGWVRNEELRVGNPSEGRIVLRPGGPGFVTEDGALGWKFLWERFVKGRLHIEGHRLDADAPPLRVLLAPTSEEIGIQPSYLIFPQAGCWRILARIHGEPLSLVIRVEKIGEGPPVRRLRVTR
jgi:hypothetical protein